MLGIRVGRRCRSSDGGGPMTVIVLLALLALLVCGACIFVNKE